MKERILVIWAVSATLVALGSVGAVGYLYGKKSAQPLVSQIDQDITHREGATVTSRPRSESEGGAAAVPRYRVPDELAGLPREWMTPDADVAEGYAILFDPASREIIVEQCAHQGYGVDEAGRPLPVKGALCSTPLSGLFDSFGEDEALVKGRDGQVVAVSIELTEAGESPELELVFNDHHMTLKPGSKNDLMQTFEARPEIKAKRREYLVALASGSREDERRMAGE